MASVLLAEDSPTHTALMRSLLESDGHRVRCVEDGRHALEAMNEELPELVVTDLRMPEMNGLELVQEIVAKYPAIPTVVVTARGSENLAVDALARGAANFVPKNSLLKLLNHVVRHTLRLARADAAYDRFSGKLIRPEFTFLIDNQVSCIEPAALYTVEALAASSSLNPTERVRIGTAISSALFNAICFGNLEIHDDHTFISRLLSGDKSGAEDLAQRAADIPYRDRTVEFQVSVAETDTRIRIAHTGPGKMARLTPAPGTPESFELEQCRGLMLMTSFMDQVTFHADSTEVVMVKRHDASGESDVNAG